MRLHREVLDMVAAQPLLSGLSLKELWFIVAVGTPVDIETGYV